MALHSVSADYGGGSTSPKNETVINDDVIKAAFSTAFASDPKIIEDINNAIRNSDSFKDTAEKIKQVTNNTVSSTRYSSNNCNVAVGDKVQIKAGGMDVTNGITAKHGVMYGEDGPLTAEVVLIDDNWYTGGNFGLPQRVTKVRCQAEGVIVWQVQPQDIVVKISSSQPVQKEPARTDPVQPAATNEGVADLGDGNKTSSGASSYGNGGINLSKDIGVSFNAYAMEEGSENWKKGIKTHPVVSDDLPDTLKVRTREVTDGGLIKPQLIKAKDDGKTWRRPTTEEQAILGTGSIWVDQGALDNETKFVNSFEDSDRLRHMLSNDTENIQNEYNYPRRLESGKVTGSEIKTAKYDYQIIPGESVSTSGQSLEDKLQTARAALGIHVHGSNSIARTVKYYMYNRFKVPDKNLNHNKSFTYVFFTRPDLYLLDCFDAPDKITVAPQVLNHTEGAMIWRRNPDLLKLLTDATRCGDNNNFNLLLSNQVRSFNIIDEKLSTIEAGNSWKKATMVYGDTYTGREAGEFSCTFEETSDYSVFNLIKLWMTYIDNVSKGAWKPSYNLFGEGVNTSDINASHVYTKTLDYGASAFVVKCGADGDDMLYWTQYFGIIPVNTGAGAFSWEHGKSIGESPTLDITFRYAMKRDLSPISLLVFNHNARIDGTDVEYESAWNGDLGHTARPYVGPPFVEMKLGAPKISPNRVDDANKTQIRLRFRKLTGTGYNDRDLYRSQFR